MRQIKRHRTRRPPTLDTDGKQINLYTLYMQPEIDVDHILELQLGVAWAAESVTDESGRRLRWWRTEMTDEDGGVDLMRRLAPRTWKWAVVESARAAAIRVDEAAHENTEDADNILSLYRLGFEVDEHLSERVADLKQGSASPEEHFPRLAELMRDGSPQRFAAWVGQADAGAFTTTATGRRLRVTRPDNLATAASLRAAALVPVGPAYPLPHFRLTR